MASRARKQKRGVSYKTGEKGSNRVRLFSHPRDGTLYVEYRVGPLKKRIALGHSDEQLGKQAADTLALKLRENEPPPQKALTLCTLFDIYLRDRDMAGGVAGAQARRASGRLLRLAHVSPHGLRD